MGFEKLRQIGGEGHGAKKYLLFFKKGLTKAFRIRQKTSGFGA
jgi:hypothetical protein